MIGNNSKLSCTAMIVGYLLQILYLKAGLGKSPKNELQLQQSFQCLCRVYGKAKQGHIHY